jgi:hypothetical protein
MSANGAVRFICAVVQLKISQSLTAGVGTGQNKFSEPGRRDAAAYPRGALELTKLLHYSFAS